MKLTNFAILFVGFAVTVCTGMDIRTKMVSSTIMADINLNQVIDRAVQDSMDAAEIYIDQEMNIQPDRENIIRNLHEKLFISLNAYGDSISRERIKECIPAAVLTEQDGYYLYGYSETEDNSGSTIRRAGFSEKRYYVTEEKGWRVRFSFSDLLELEHIKTGAVYECTWYQAAGRTGLDMFKKREKFEERRRRAVIENVRNDMEGMVNRDPSIREDGAGYLISFPYIEYEEWYQTVKGISLLVFFRGHPVGMAGREYNYVVFSGARIEKHSGE